MKAKDTIRDSIKLTLSKLKVVKILQGAKVKWRRLKTMGKLKVDLMVGHTQEAIRRAR